MKRVYTLPTTIRSRGGTNEKYAYYAVKPTLTITGNNNAYGIYYYGSMYLPGILGTRCRTSSTAKLPSVAERTGRATVSADEWPYIV